MYRCLIILLLFVLPHVLHAWNCNDSLEIWDKKDKKQIEQRKYELDGLIEKAYASDSCKCLANALRRRGTYWKDKGKLDSAIANYLKALQYAESVNDLISQASSNNQVGAVYYLLNKNKQAYDHFLQAFELYKLKVHYQGMADAALNCASVRLDENQIEDAEHWSDESFKHRKKSSDTSGIGSNYAVMASIALKKQDAEQAEVFFKMAMDLSGKLKGKYAIPLYIDWGMSCADRQMPDTALYYLRKAYHLAVAYEYQYLKADAAEKLAGLFSGGGLSDSAYYYSEQAREAGDSLHNQLILIATVDAVEKYDSEKKEAALIHEKALSDERRLVINLLLALLFVFAVGVLFLLRSIFQRRKLREKETALRSASAMIEGQDSERERIARELHDRIGSMLSAVKLQFSSMEEQFEVWKLIQRESYTKALQMLDDTYEEVRRISHDLDTGLLSRFGLRTAMLQLVQLISSTNKLKVTFIDNGIDPACYKPYETDLYRITQELLSNTIKYAGASEVSIQLSRSDKKLIYSYEDDGIGFDKNVLKIAPGIGFKNIFHRIERYKGTWQLETSPGNGFNLIIELKCDEGNADHNSR